MWQNVLRTCWKARSLPSAEKKKEKINFCFFSFPKAFMFNETAFTIDMSQNSWTTWLGARWWYLLNSLWMFTQSNAPTKKNKQRNSKKKCFFASVLVSLDAFCIWGPTELLSSLYKICAWSDLNWKSIKRWRSQEMSCIIPMVGCHLQIRTRIKRLHWKTKRSACSMMNWLIWRISKK